MIINGKNYRKLKIGEIVRKNDVHNDGHKVFSDMVGQKLKKADMKYYSVYRKKNDQTDNQS